MNMSFDKLYQETIDYLYGLQKYGIKLGLSNSLRLMEMVGDPHQKFRSVHVAGTNGKGSTAAFIATMLLEAGYRVGLYTSPHLVDFRERIRINNVPIAEARVIKLGQRLRDACRTAVEQDGPGQFVPTFFEVTTALAFAYFAEEQVDIAVVEAGMGGRFDATNVIAPLVSIITTIDIEHTEFLGNTVERIAAEKAGIIKAGVPVITGAVQQEAVSVIEQAAASQRAPLYRLYRDFMPQNILLDRAQAFDYQGITNSYSALRSSLLGRYQIDNASCALAAIECLREARIRVAEPAIRRGLEGTRWEGRMEQVAARPDIFLDGAHNPASSKKLAETIRGMKSAYQRVVLVIGVLKDKDHQGIVSNIVPLADHVVATRPDCSRALDIPTLAAEIAKLHAPVVITETVEEAIAKATSAASPDDLVLVMGSLYVVGDARKMFFPGAASMSVFSELKG